MRLEYDPKIKIGSIQKNGKEIGVFYPLEDGKWVVTIYNVASTKVASRDAVRGWVHKKLG